MRIERWVPWAAALAALAVGLLTAGPSPAWAQDEAGNEEAAPKVEKRVIRIVDGDEDKGQGEGKVGYLGVQVQALTPSLRRAKSVPGSVEGALINRVEEGSPAAKAGVKKGDIVLEVDQTETPDPDKLIEVVRDLTPGAEAKVLILRDGARKTFYVVVGSRPAEYFEAPMPGARGGWDPEVLRWRMDTMRRHSADVERQLADIQDEIAKLRREIRELRSELKMGSEGRGRD